MVRFFIVFLLIAFSTNAYADYVSREENPIEKKFINCAQKNTSTNGFIQCCEKSESEWEIVLNKTYKKLMKGLPKNAADNLRDSQRLWIKMREKDNLVMRDSLPRGSISEKQLSKYRLNFVRNRALTLVDMYFVTVFLGDDGMIVEEINKLFND